ncbi:MAG: hypothetical protein L0312_30585, partial [Acidobacteria bacterium]|nr:hypothetical protein [Acidobacteriota bacterium]
MRRCVLRWSKAKLRARVDEPKSAAPVTFSLPAGFSVLGSFELPTDLTQVVDTIGVESRVTARGTLPVDKIEVRFVRRTGIIGITTRATPIYRREVTPSDRVGIIPPGER